MVILFWLIEISSDECLMFRIFAQILIKEDAKKTIIIHDLPFCALCQWHGTVKRPCLGIGL